MSESAMVECPHCGDPELEVEGEPGLGTCAACMRPSGCCPRCGTGLRLFNYWRRPGILPPLPAKRPITFAVEEHPSRGPFATFEEGGHRYRFWAREAVLDVLACDAAG